MPRWVDLSAHGLALKVRKQGDLRWLVLEPQPGTTAVPGSAAEQLGFALSDGSYQREGTKITLSEVQRVFPLAGVREFNVDELRAASEAQPAVAKSVPWWETAIADRYASVYLIGNSRGKDALTFVAEGEGYVAAATQAGVRRERWGSLAEITHWLRSDVLVGMGDAVAGKILSVEELRSRLRLVKGEDLLQPPAPAVEMVPAPQYTVPAGNWRNVLDALSVRGSIPIGKVPWLKIDRDKWTDGTQILDTATLVSKAERIADVLEGEVAHAQPSLLEAMQQSGHLVVAAVPARDAGGPESIAEAVAAAAALSRSQFVQQAQAVHAGGRWNVTLNGAHLDLPAELAELSPRKRPETILADAHEALVRQVTAKHAFACTSFAALVSYPTLAFPGALSRGRMSEINLMRLLDKLGVADKLMEGDSGYCVLANPPYMDLVIERHGFGASTDKLYLTHYFEQNGDRILDAEMVFEIDRGRPRLKETATVSLRGGELRGLDRAFANMFSRNLLQQGFGDATVKWPHEDDSRLDKEEEAPEIALTPH